MRLGPPRSAPRTAALAVLAALTLGACGSSSNGAVTVPKVAPARVFTLGRFSPSATVVAGRPTTLSFTVALPSGKPLTSYRTGPGPHTGVHLITSATTSPTSSTTTRRSPRAGSCASP
ncbi:MAG: hypothetical protein ACR2MK_07355 [Solirubrobacteraceae bacterium]